MCREMAQNGSFLITLFILVTCLKVLLLPAYYSSDFEVHRNWLAITNSLPLERWYYECGSEWTLDYPPFFAYFEWLLSQFAKYVDPQMLLLDNHNYASAETKYFQRITVMITDLIYAVGIRQLINAMKFTQIRIHKAAAETLLLANIGLLFIDHIHFQYNGFLFGIFLLAISCILKGHYILGTLAFCILLNFKHIFLYVAPAFAVYLLRFYCLNGVARESPAVRIIKLMAVALVTFMASFGPFYKHIPQILNRLFPFKRGLTHSYWAPNFWALYNTLDKLAAKILKPNQLTLYTSGVVQDYEHIILPTIKPLVTFLLTMIAMLPILVKLLLLKQQRTDRKVQFLRCIVLCSLASFVFGWHVHEKAILIPLIPLCFLYFVHFEDAKYTFLLSAAGYFSLFPLLFDPDLILIRYSLYLAYMAFMYGQHIRLYKKPVDLNSIEFLYLFGFILLLLYEHVISPVLDLDRKLPFMHLLLTSSYCSLGVLYVFIRYYLYTMDVKLKFGNRVNWKKNRNRQTSNKKNKPIGSIGKWQLDAKEAKKKKKLAKFQTHSKLDEHPKHKKSKERMK